MPMSRDTTPSDGHCDGKAGGVAGFLALAATPCFVVMALCTGPLDDAPLICSMSPFGGMAPMYLLMALFHAAPWMRLVERCVAEAQHAWRCRATENQR
jgi:hypothetical protein